MATNFPEVLAVPAEVLSGYYDRTEFRSEPERVRDALNIVRKHGQFYLRRWAEQTESVRQVIPCVIVRNGARLLCVKRAKNGRDDLRLRYTLLFGGHARPFFVLLALFASWAAGAMVWSAKHASGRQDPLRAVSASGRGRVLV